MQKKSIHYILIALLFIIGCNSPINTDEKAQKTVPVLTDKLDEYFSALASLQKFNGLVLIQKNGELILPKEHYRREKVNENTIK